MLSYTDFLLSLDRLPGSGGYLATARGPAGEALHSVTLPQRAEFLALVARLMRHDTDEALLEDLGQELFLALFDGGLRDVYLQAQGALAAQPDRRLRVRLVLQPDDADAASLPWEFLYDPQRGPLALIDVPIVRHLAQPAPLATPPEERSPRVLLSAARPRGLPGAAEAEAELAAAREALGSLAPALDLVVEPQLTGERLQELLGDGIDVWHFVGHGAVDARRGAGLVLADALGDPRPLFPAELGILLTGRCPRLALLTSCDSGAALDSLRSAAVALVRAGVPYVVAQQAPVETGVTRAFASQFYRALAEGLPIETCVTEGRRAIMRVAGLGSASWGIPVLFSRVADPPEQAERAVGERARPAPAPAARRVASFSAHRSAGLPAAEALLEQRGDARLRDRAPEPAPLQAVQVDRRIDAALPRALRSGERADLLVQVRFPGSPQLGVRDWLSPRRPAAVDQASADVALLFPENPESGQLDISVVVLQVAAEGLRLLSPSVQHVEVPADRYSQRVRFELIAEQPGPATVTLQAYGVGAGAAFGRMALRTVVGEERAEADEPMAAASVVVRARPAEGQRCGQCGGISRGTARFCRHCGAPLAAESPRRTVSQRDDLVGTGRLTSARPSARPARPADEGDQPSAGPPRPEALATAARPARPAEEGPLSSGKQMPIEPPGQTGVWPAGRAPGGPRAPAALDDDEEPPARGLSLLPALLAVGLLLVAAGVIWWWLAR